MRRRDFQTRAPNMCDTISKKIIIKNVDLHWENRYVEKKSYLKILPLKTHVNMPTGNRTPYNHSHRTPRSHCTLTPWTDRTWLGGGRAITAPRQPPRNLFPDTRPFEERALFVLAPYRWSEESSRACRVNGGIPGDFTSTTRTSHIPSSAV